MQTRTEKSRKRKQEFRNEIIGIPIRLLFLIVSLLIYMFTLILWEKLFHGTIYYNLMHTIINTNIVIVSLFVIIGYSNLTFLIIIVKSLLKILFTVWIAIIVQFSSFEQVEKNAWILLYAFAFVYLEVLLEINNYLFKIKGDFRMPKMEFLTSTFIRKNSISISILLVSIINGILTYFIIKLLDLTKFV